MFKNLFGKKQEAEKKFHQAHRQNVLKSLEHRLKVAKASGNEYLVQQLEAEMEHYS